MWMLGIEPLTTEPFLQQSIFILQISIILHFLSVLSLVTVLQQEDGAPGDRLHPSLTVQL